MLYGVAGLVVGVLIGVFAAPTVAPEGMYSGMNQGGMSRTMASSVDRHFIEQMLPHHEGAIAMAEVALERSTRPEIRSFAEGIIEAQTRENGEMRAWYRNWFGGEVSEAADATGMMGHGDMRMAGMEGDLDRLRAAEDFDLEFIRQMDPHHEMAVVMAQMLLSGTEREEMRTLAEQIITSQSREIDMMRNWYAAWSANAQ